MFDSFLLPFVLHGRINLYLGFLYLFTYTGVQANFQIMFVSVNSNRKGDIIGKRTAYPSGSHEFDPCFNAQSYVVVFCCVSFRLLFALVWSFFDWWYLIIALVSSKFFKHSAMLFNATLNNISIISWRSVVLVEETRVLGENHQPVPSHWQISEHNLHAMRNICCFFRCDFIYVRDMYKLHMKYAIET